MIRKILIAPDSFKDSMSAKTVCDTIEKAILEVDSKYIIEKVAMADGGEGTIESLKQNLNGKIVKLNVKGPLLENVEAEYILDEKSKTAFIEMASASGLELVPIDKRNPYYTSSYGTGELILHAVNKGAKNIIIAIGGSATVDAGVGMLMALGAKILDKDKKSIKLGGKYLSDIESIDISAIPDINITVARDVENTLTGINGASYVFGPQKGAKPEMLEMLDNNLKHFAKIVRKQHKKEVENIKGAGAAGGLGAALLLIGAKLEKGIDIVMKLNKLEEKIIKSDLIITGEGKLDSQTILGKTCYGVAKLSKKHNKPVIAFSGILSEDSEILSNYGIDAMFSIVNSVESLENALNNADKNLYKTVKNVFRLIGIKE
ncbi:glycerate kinase [Oceanivirga miroungae]|uniref:Glycerate 2-kinase n=1 Tax=Oceanivirga miroungae TaxID=1130046 RepID=A0A6I8MCQ3_9FUSO|nr:glycerate kinase [Oceanivirga miroungae]VWL84909.1 Glycerate 2-kinase [Oceanivirga miroungae]